ncbi:MAG: hypothetical protein DRI34_10625 [Deltaproteobacteria bacterium]|nr:MAG: hypothetical protein DRI34_10625 [Deltaproteobacteria bacterium]
MGLRRLMVTLILAAVLLPVAAALLLGGTASDTGGCADSSGPDRARLTARLIGADINRTASIFRIGAELFDLPALSRRECIGVLRMLYKQDDSIAQVVLLNGEDRPVVEPVFLTAEQVAAHPHSTRLPVGATALERFLNQIPLAAVRRTRLAYSDPYVSPNNNSVLVAGAVSLPVAGGRSWVLAFERSLRRLQRLLSTAVTGSGAVAFLVDSGGRVLAHPDGRLMLERRLVDTHPLVQRFLRGERSGRARWRDEQNREINGSFWRLDFLDWAVVIQEPLAPRSLSWSLPWWTYPVWGALAVVVLLLGLLVERRTVSVMGEMQALRLAAEKRAEQLKRLQASLLESGKLSAIGDLGAGVAHEFNNPLGGILGLVQLLLRKKKEDDPDRNFLERIEQEAKRCKAITENLLRFSEQQGLEHREPVRLERVIDAALGLVSAKFASKHIKIDKRFAEGVPRILGQEGQMQRALLNLLFNADTAMPEGGTCTVRLEAADGRVLVRLRDSGRGIPPENLERVFEPFFTTKANWRGAGLGLTEVYQIVRAHDGEISIDSQEGQGTEVVMSFPAEPKRPGQDR